MLGDQVAVWLSMRGLSVEAAEVRQAVEQAWLTLNHEMIALGLKEAPVENPDPFASPERPASMG